MDISPLISHFSRYLPLNEKEIEVLISMVEVKKVKRKQFILQQGDICKYYSFVASGCFKMYKVDETGKEHNIDFSIESQWMVDIDSFHNDKPTELYIEAMEAGEVFQIKKKDLLYLYTHFPKFDRNFRVVIENEFIKLQHRLLLNLSANAETRYLHFAKNYPELFNRISNVQIASYLGVTPEFLSKIRKNIVQS